MMSAGGTVVLEYGQADWVIVRNILQGLGSTTTTVFDPTVFAPNTWDWP